MKKNIKRSRKKLTNSEPKDDSLVSGELKDGNDVLGEQSRLCKQLEDYTREFERRLEQLNFTPNDRDLVILYIMNLHPRWKRLVEPLELTFHSWREAAQLARHHCAKASAILGAKRQDSLDILRSPESMALLSAGYFVPESHPFVQRYPGAEAVRHLIQGYTNESSSPSSSSTTSLSVPSSPTLSSSEINTNSLQHLKPSINTSKVKSESSTTPIKPSPQKEPVTVVDENTATTNTTADKSLEKPSVEKPTLEKPTPLNNTLEKPTPKPTKASPKTPNAKAGKSKSNKTSICYRIPKEHTSVNLGFLELNLSDNTVKALLSKMHWFVSAISLDCAKRLGLDIMPRKKEPIKTSVFSFEEPIGIVQFPISQHSIPLYVLPMIYNGKVDMVLGSDFFDIFNSTLNIKARAIYYMDKESPYSVSHL
ncbi:hypothetical protein K501DRAFT_236456 [Backusella circina FSU 941]|nr:hypothetical protein K501DRAFT_236456 [Backusella circina FSU 941]